MSALATMEWTTGFEGRPDKGNANANGNVDANGNASANGNVVTRRILVSANNNHHSNTQPSAPDTPTITTPSDTPVNGSVAASVAASVAGSVDGSANGSTISTAELRRAFRNKYRHVQAIHSQSKPSCLSHDTTETPSFIGFRNLMAIVLGKAYRHPAADALTDTNWPVASNLRLVIENIQKVGWLTSP